MQPPVPGDCFIREYLELLLWICLIIKTVVALLDKVHQIRIEKYGFVINSIAQGYHIYKDS